MRVNADAFTNIHTVFGFVVAAFFIPSIFSLIFRFGYTSYGVTSLCACVRAREL